jgi:hypothetical protein
LDKLSLWKFGMSTIGGAGEREKGEREGEREHGRSCRGQHNIL